MLTRFLFASNTSQSHNILQRTTKMTHRFKSDDSNTLHSGLGKSAEAKHKATGNANPKDARDAKVSKKSLISRLQAMDHFNGRVGRSWAKFQHLALYTALQAKTPVKEAQTPVEAPQEQISTFAENYRLGKKMPADAIAPLTMDGKVFIKAIVHSAIHGAEYQGAIEAVGKLMDRAGIPKHDRPQFAPVSLYGTMFDQFIANTHGLRDDVYDELSVLTDTVMSQLREEYPECKFHLRTKMLDTRMDETHPTFGSLMKARGDATDKLGQAMHAQTQFLIETKEGEFIPYMTIEASGSANHPMGEHAEIPSFSFNGDHKNAKTIPLPVRTATKDGARDLSNVTPYMSSIMGQNTNTYYAVRGGFAQQPNGLEYPNCFNIDLPLDDVSAWKGLQQFLLVEKGGQVIVDGEPGSETVLSAGTLGQHGQGGGLGMCMSAALYQSFGPDGLGFLSNPRAFPDSFEKPETTFGVATGLLLGNLSNGAVLRRGDDSPVGLDKLRDVIGDRFFESYRKAGNIVDKPVFIGGFGTVFEVNPRDENAPPVNMEVTDSTHKKFDQFTVAGRVSTSRYTPKQQEADFGRMVGFGSPRLPEEREAVEAYIAELGNIYELDATEVRACIDMLPPKSHTVTVPREEK